MAQESKDFSRRDLLKAGTVMAAATLIPNLANTKASSQTSKKYWTEKQIQPKDFTPLIVTPPSGMSSRQISEHLGLYKKYVSKLNKVHEQEKKTGITHDSLINKGFAYGGTVLHELYFGNLSQAPTKINQSELLNAINRQYGNFDNFISNFKTAGKSSRGWTILGLNLFDGNLDIFGLDAHNEGTMLSYIWPVVVMDVYEHAYMIDHGTNKQAYINDFVKNINWNIAEARFNQGLKNISNADLII
ncbi:MAG: Fe-Mn family superoxide dismutase [Candidatus Caenarcaniphilales bacterium]|nr:Fe-Mn family superoxide dismutase [Candidatus Caenarcaniphilales bacterium]